MSLKRARRFAAATLTLAAMLAAPLAQAQWTNLNRLGTNDAVCAGGVQNSVELQAWFAGNRGDVEKMMSDAGMGGATDQLLSKIAAGDFRETSFDAGQEFQWMGRRSKGVPTVKNMVRYTGAENQRAIALNVEANCATHEILIPLTCCNVSLVTTKPAAAPGTPSLNVVPPSSCDAGTAQVSADAGGADVELTLIGPDGSESRIIAGAVDLNSPGDYKVRASAVNSCGIRSDRRAVASFSVADCPAPQPVAKAPEPTPAPAPAPAPAPKAKEPVKMMPKAAGFIPFVAGYIGAQSRTRDLCYCVKDQTEGFFGARGGVMYPLSDRLSLLGQVGGALNTEDNGSWDSVHADVGLEYKVGKSGFIGGGVGVWDLNSSLYRDPTVFIHGGVDTPWKVGDGTVQWFVEGRKWLDEPFDEEKYDGDYAGMTGLRLMWK